MFKPQIRHALVGISLATLFSVAAASVVNHSTPQGSVSVEYLGVVNAAEVVPEVLVVAKRLPATVRLAGQALSAGTALLK